MTTTMEFPAGLSATGLTELIELLREASDREVGTVLPIISPVALLGHRADQGRSDILPVGHARFHEAQTCQWHRAVGPGVSLIGEVLQSGKLIRSTVSDADGLVYSAEARIDVIAHDRVANFGAVAAPAHLHTPDVCWTRFPPLNAGLVTRYVTLAKDPNPIHVDDGAAQAVGLASAIVPGMLIAGLAEYAISEHWTGLKARFVAPVAVGSSLRFAVRGSRVVVVRDDGVLAAVVDLQAAA